MAKVPVISADPNKSIRQTKTARNSVIDLMGNGMSQMKTADGSLYLGGWDNGKMHGLGILFF